MTATPRHVIFGTGAIGLVTFDALLGRGETARLVNRSGHARVRDDVEVIGGDTRDPAFTTTVAAGAGVVHQTLNPPYAEWRAQFPLLQAGVLAAAEPTAARLVSMENVYMYGRAAGRVLTEDRAYEMVWPVRRPARTRTSPPVHWPSCPRHYGRHRQSHFVLQRPTP